ncbi:uncharacterized protein [Littorina saxatilis]|uniref:uncharacterized protein isoform X2 n=1 Tax=Littorina saxatilis TaxID=31220 RepID=UPI0038B5B67E
MRAEAPVFWILVTLTQGLSEPKTNVPVPIPLGSESGIQISGGNGNGNTNTDNLSNSLPTFGNIDLESGNVLSHVLEKLENVEQGNQRLRQDLEHLTRMMEAVQEENLLVRQQMSTTAAQMASLGEQAEVMQSVLATVQEFEDQGVNFTTRLAQLDLRLAQVEGSLLQFQVEGCGCSQQIAGVRSRLDMVETALGNVENTPPSSTVTSPTPRSTYSTYGWAPRSTRSTIDWAEYTEAGSHRISAVPPSAFGSKEILVNSILVTREGKLVLADRIGSWLLLSTRDQPGTFLDSQRLSYAPWALLELPDGNIAVTLEFSHDIAIYSVAGGQLELVRTIHTGADYGGIAPGPEENTLIVSKWRLDSVARLDVINMEGEVLHTLLDDSEFPLVDPYCLRRFGDDVYVSDWTSDGFFSVNIYTGEVSTTMGGLNLMELPLEAPRAFDMDDNGDVYLATESSLCSNGFCILRITQGGQVTAMKELTGQFGGGYPYAVEVTATEVILSWANWDYQWVSELTFYSLPASSELTMPTPAALVMSTEAGSHRISAVPPSAFGSKEILVNSILVTREGKLVLADRIGSWLLMSTRDQPGTFLDSQRLSYAPWALLELPDGNIAVTLEFSHDIAIYSVAGGQLELVRTIHTGADYGGIAPGPEENTLIVSKWRLDSVARLDVINMEGEVLHTLLDDSELLVDPYCLRRFGDDVYVSDWTSDGFFSVNIYTGEVSTTMGGLNLMELPLEAPRAFDMDDNGDVYLATESSLCSNGFCILRITQGGQVTAMKELTGQFGGGYPYAVEVTATEVILSWANWDYQWVSELTFYSLPASSELTMPTPAALVMSTARHLQSRTAASSELTMPTPAALVMSTAFTDTFPPSTTRGPRSQYATYSGSLFTSILITEEGKILTADYHQETVKMISMTDLERVEDTLGVGLLAWGLADLGNGTVVVTSEDQPQIAFISVNESRLEMEEKVYTKRRYRGVAVCGDGSLVVSSRQNDDDSSNRDARIDVISRNGDVIDTLLEGGNFTDLVKPLFLTCRGEELYVSDWSSHKVFVLNTETREVSSAFGNMDLSDLQLSQPRVVAFDREGHMYVATGGKVCVADNDYSYYDEDESFCIIQISPEGSWKHLERYTTPVAGLFPYGIGITGDQIFISWGRYTFGTWFTDLAAYDLPASLKET